MQLNKNHNLFFSFFFLDMGILYKTNRLMRTVSPGARGKMKYLCFGVKSGSKLVPWSCEPCCPGKLPHCGIIQQLLLAH